MHKKIQKKNQFNNLILIKDSKFRYKEISYYQSQVKNTL